VDRKFGLRPDDPTLGIARHLGVGREQRRYVRAFVAATTLACASLTVSGCASTELTLVNQSTAALRLSGCFIDDALDLGVGQTVNLAIPAGRGRWGCDVYRYPLEPLHYVGCLVVHEGKVAYVLEGDVDTRISENACDRI
jgi:hypothetical protein